MSKKITGKFRTIYCPMAKKTYPLEDGEKCCPCCGDDLENPRPGHYIYEEEVING